MAVHPLKAFALLAPLLALVVTGLAFIMPIDPPRMPSNPQAFDTSRPTIQPMALAVPANIPTSMYDAN